VTEHSTMSGSSLDLDVAAVSPPGAPAVLDEPVVEASLVSVADNGDCVVVLVAENVSNARATILNSLQQSLIFLTSELYHLVL